MNFPCNACHQRFDSLTELHQHCSSLFHPYPCTHSGCHRSFKNQDALQHHLDSKAHPYECHECKREFKSRPALQAHLNSPAYTPSKNGNGPNQPSQLTQTSQKHGSLPSQANLIPHGRSGRSPRNQENPSQQFSPPMHITPRKSRPRKRSSGTPQVLWQDMNSLAHNLMPKDSVDQDYEKEGPVAPVLTGLELQSPMTELSALSKQLCNSLGCNDPDYGTAQNIENVSSYTIIHERNSWSVIPVSRCTDMLDALAKRCHSLEDLRKHNYFLSLDGANKPQRSQSRFQEFAPTPPRSSQRPKRHAIALDCEMVGVEGDMSELALISAVDFITGEVLLNTLVRPLKKVMNWRSPVSGVTAHAMALASTQGQSLNGWKEARAELWRHIDTDTILVGQALQHDLGVLRMMHLRVVDTAILAEKAVGAGVRRNWGLKVLCEELLDIEIQNHGSHGHDCLEDTFAAREVAIWCIQNERDLTVWGKVANEMEREKQKAQRERRALKQKQKQKKKRSLRVACSTSESDDEMVRWEDIAEDLGWPHPDTGYDPWSD